MPAARPIAGVSEAKLRELAALYHGKTLTLVNLLRNLRTAMGCVREAFAKRGERPARLRAGARRRARHRAD